ncbi:NAD+ kinase [Sediminihabitans luteus]|uniref:NAD kinase n=1 Tax=Sediminihabitans luteus TaxID=1138585 RepID=A0A2M9CRI3_9CELL|nr:NAD kinase [Sediminihabitans luteus]PJJ74438.1 NAD+ kinase [Sediminihabitans luteus]GIJ00195.1 NAD kinase [Sediminihabitans luteus]
MTRRVLIVTHGGRETAVAAAREAARELEAVGFAVSLHDDDLAEGFGPEGEEIEVVRDKERVEESEVVLVMGGDGTLLRAAELTHGTDVPLLGVNLGHVGFLAESDRDDLRTTVQRLAACDYTVEERGTIDVTVHLPEGGEPVRGWALNEATVEKASRERMIEVAVEVDGRPMSSFGCDGVVMSTATGSTAHAFSAGGPVVWPDVDAMLLVPISAHALFARPVVVGPRSVLAVEVATTSSSPGVLMCDGRRQIDLPVGSRVEVRRCPDPIRLARLSAAPFTDRLVSKFSLPVVGWRGGTARSALTGGSTSSTTDEEGSRA